MYFMHHVLHDWPDEDVVRIFAQTAKAMKPGYSKLLLGENVLQDVDCHLFPALLDWGMMALHCGMTRTVGRWRSLCEKSGLKLVKYWPPPGDGDGILEVELQ
jgi:O-methyltransferase domain